MYALFVHIYEHHGWTWIEHKAKTIITSANVEPLLRLATEYDVRIVCAKIEVVFDSRHTTRNFGAQRIHQVEC